MPKKVSSARGSSQRQRAKAQKSIELVRPVTPEGPQIEESTPTEQEETPVAVAEPKSRRRTRRGRREAATSILDNGEKEDVEETQKEEAAEEVVPATPRGAAARIAARRQATQRAQQRSAQSLISPEHFAYVSRDLATIGVLAVLMLTIIIVLYFTIGKTL